MRQRVCRLCHVYSVFSLVFPLLWQQLTLRSITLLSSLVSWLTVARLSWGQTKNIITSSKPFRLWNIQRCKLFCSLHRSVCGQWCVNAVSEAFQTSQGRKYWRKHAILVIASRKIIVHICYQLLAAQQGKKHMLCSLQQPLQGQLQQKNLQCGVTGQ